jgi:hypothetical protein
MKLIRQIVIGLALLSAFICLTVFSETQYNGKDTNLNITEDKLPIAKIVLAKLSEFLPYSDKIMALSSSPVAKDAYNQASDIAKNNPNITPENIKPALDMASSSLKNTLDIASSSVQSTNWLEILNKIKAGLSKNWSQP